MRTAYHYAGGRRAGRTTHAVLSHAYTLAFLRLGWCYTGIRSKDHGLKLMPVLRWRWP